MMKKLTEALTRGLATTDGSANGDGISGINSKKFFFKNVIDYEAVDAAGGVDKITDPSKYVSLMLFDMKLMRNYINNQMVAFASPRGMYPKIGEYLQNMRIVFIDYPELNTMAVDRYGNLYMAPGYVYYLHRLWKRMYTENGEDFYEDEMGTFAVKIDDKEEIKDIAEKMIQGASYDSLAEDTYAMHKGEFSAAGVCGDLGEDSANVDSNPYLLYVILHELYHNMYGHHVRGDHFTNKHADWGVTPEKLNIVMDLEINSMLEAYAMQGMNITETIGGIYPHKQSENPNYKIDDDFHSFLYGESHTYFAEGGYDEKSRRFIMDFTSATEEDRIDVNVPLQPWEKVFEWLNQHDAWEKYFGPWLKKKVEKPPVNPPEKPLNGIQEIYDQGYFDGYRGNTPDPSLMTDHPEYAAGIEDGAGYSKWDKAHNTDEHDPDFISGFESGDVNESYISLAGFTPEECRAINEDICLALSHGIFEGTWQVDKTSDAYRHGVEAKRKKLGLSGSGKGQQGQKGQGGRQSGKDNQNNQNEKNDGYKRQGDLDLASEADIAQQAANQAQQSANNVQQSANEAQREANEAQESGAQDAAGKQDAADKAQDAANQAQEAANQAQEAANEAREANNNGDREAEKNASQKAQEAAQKARDIENRQNGQNGQQGQTSEAQQAANDAQTVANQAQSAANRAQQAANQAQGTKGANKAQQAADKAQQAADKAQQAANQAQQAANQAQEAQEQGDQKGEQQATKNAQQANQQAQKANQQAQKAAGQQGQQQSGQQGQQQAQQNGQQAQQNGQQAQQNGQQSNGQQGQQNAQQGQQNAQQGQQNAQQAQQNCQNCQNGQQGQNGQNGQSGQSGGTEGTPASAQQNAQQGQQNGKNAASNAQQAGSSQAQQNANQAQKNAQQAQKNAQQAQQNSQNGGNPGGELITDDEGTPGTGGPGGDSGPGGGPTPPGGGPGGGTPGPINRHKPPKEDGPDGPDGPPGGTPGSTPGGPGTGTPPPNDYIEKIGGTAADYSKKEYEPHVIDDTKAQELAEQAGVPDVNASQDFWKDAITHSNGRYKGTIAGSDDPFAKNIGENMAEKRGIGDQDYQNSHEGFFTGISNAIEEATATFVDWQTMLANFIRGAFKAPKDRWNYRRTVYMPDYLKKKQKPRGGKSMGNICIAVDESGSVDLPLLKVFFKEIREMKDKLGWPVRNIITFAFAGNSNAYFGRIYPKGEVEEPQQVDATGGTDFGGAMIGMLEGRMFDIKDQKHRFWDSEESAEFPVVTIFMTDGEDEIPVPEKIGWDPDQHKVIWFYINSKSFCDESAPKIEAMYGDNSFIGVEKADIMKA